MKHRLRSIFTTATVVLIAACPRAMAGWQLDGIPVNPSPNNQFTPSVVPNGNGAVSSVAGTICGTVRNARDSQAVAQAAVFLFDNLNAYTGRYAATDVNGFYCIQNVPAGTYQIKVQVDGFVTTVITNVVVDNATTVDVNAVPRFYLGQPAPNPASSGVAFRMVTPRDENVTLEVFDVHGRLVKGWSGVGTGDRSVYWDMRDTRGSAVASGVYVVRLRAGSAQQARRLVCVR